MLGTQHHIAITCSDYEKTLAFYKKLGFDLVRRWRREVQGDYLTLLRCGDITLEVFENPTAVKMPDGTVSPGLRHLAFRVEDVAKTVRELNALGIETEPVREDKVNGGCLSFFRDPDGLLLELHE